MTFGKPDGNHFVFSCDCKGNWSIFFPRTRFTKGLSFGFGWHPNGIADLRPFFSIFVIGDKPFGRMWHLRRPYNVVRVGEWFE